MRNAIVNIGIIGVIILITGALFKLSQWPGGIIIIATGSVFLTIYLFMFMIEHTKTSNNLIARAYGVIFCISGILMIIGFPLELMRWPYTKIIFIAFFISYIGLLIISLFRATREKSQELKYIYINNFLFILGGGIILLYPSMLWIIDKL